MLALKEGSHHHALYGHILEEVRALSINLSQAQFQHIKRQGNIVAHALARHAQHCADLEVWMRSVPPTQEHLLSIDFPS